MWKVKTVVPHNIGELLTPLGLCYWICDDGSFCQKTRTIVIITHGFTLEEVNLLIKALTDKFELNCTIKKDKIAFAIRISPKSLPILKKLLAPHMPSMMRFKIGL
jgi:hypothetical protein